MLPRQSRSPGHDSRARYIQAVPVTDGAATAGPGAPAGTDGLGGPGDSRRRAGEATGCAAAARRMRNCRGPWAVVQGQCSRQRDCKLTRELGLDDNNDHWQPPGLPESQAFKTQPRATDLGLRIHLIY
jgi:hypothetical protein